MNKYEQERMEKNVRHAAGINALRKIGEIVAEEQQADAEKARVLRWFVRYGWLVLLGGVLLFSAYFGLI
jgi:hypothetical protein